MRNDEVTKMSKLDVLMDSRSPKEESPSGKSGGSRKAIPKRGRNFDYGRRNSTEPSFKKNL